MRSLESLALEAFVVMKERMRRRMSSAHHSHHHSPDPLHD